MNFDIETESQQKMKKKEQESKKLYIIAGVFLGLAILLLLIFVIAGSGKKETPQPPSTPVVVQKETSKLKIYDEESNTRPIAIIIDNNIGEALHAGLQHAYISYEMIVEGGLTRIMALYKDKNLAAVGPIRSARHYFFDYALESDAIVVHHGWSPQAETDITKLNVNNVNGLVDQKAFIRDTTSVAPHNVFSTSKIIYETIKEKSYSTEANNWKLFNYSTEEIDISENDSTAKEAIKVSMDYSYYENRSYTYDSSSKYYLREMNGKAHNDRKTKSQLNYKNIIIMKVENKKIDEADRQELTTVGKGTGYFITDGKAVEIEWNKLSRTDKTVYTYKNGQEIILNDGNTFIQIVPMNSKITIE